MDPEALPLIEIGSDAEIRYGELNDGVGASVLRDYLSNFRQNGLRRLSGYQVRVIGQSTREERRRVLAAVQLVNAALPEGAKLSVGPPRPDLSFRTSVDSYGIYRSPDNELPNTIHIEYMPIAQHHSYAGGTSWGEYIQLTQGTHTGYTIEQQATTLIAHELLHSLGMRGHVPVRFDSIMEAGNEIYLSRQSERRPASILYPVDREALRALYGPLLSSTDPRVLGPWSNSAEHFFIGNEYGAVGVAMRNDYAEPWAYGIEPNTDLAAMRNSGSARWTGALVGFTPSSVRVVGDALIIVNFPSMEGSANFSDLEQMQTESITRQWNEGDLLYMIAVQGNTLREKTSSRDDGRLTGIFVGPSHEAVGGTLERSDLTAAFGAER